MVNVSNLLNLDIYTNAGYYVGRAEDVVLNIRLGTVSKLLVRAIEPHKKQLGIRGVIERGLQFSPDENDTRGLGDNLLTVDYDKVQAIGDIILINIKDVKMKAPVEDSKEVFPENNEFMNQNK